MAKASTKTRRRAPVRNLDEEVHQLEQQVRDLNSTVSYQADQLKWRDETLAATKRSVEVLQRELEDARNMIKVTGQARLEVARLEGLIQGLERAGKIEPQADLGFVPGYLDR